MGGYELMTSSPDRPQILVIDDEMGPRESLRMLLKPNYTVHTADCVETGIRLLREKHPDAIVMDIRMPGMTGIDGLRRIREIDPNLSVIMLTGFGALETAQEALRLGANDYISKPFDAHAMQEVIGRNVERTRVHRSSENAASEIKELNNRLLKELAQKERLASLGQASAEFVHDLGNPLTIVWGYVQLLAKKLEQSEKRNGDAEAVCERKLGEGAEHHRAECEAMPGVAHDVAELRNRRRFSAQTPFGFRNREEVVKGVEAMAGQNGVALQNDSLRRSLHASGQFASNHARHSKCLDKCRASRGGKEGLGQRSLHAKGFLRRRSDRRHRGRHYLGANGEDFRSVFHDQAGKKRNGPRSLHHEEGG